MTDWQPTMNRALEAARAAGAAGDVPVGAVIVDIASHAIVATAGNRVERDRDPTAHAEMLAIRAAAQFVGDKHLATCALVVTLEPCAMCAQAISLARLGTLVFGAYDPKGGGVDHGARVFDQPTCHHRPEVIGGVHETACAEMLKGFFASRR